MHDTLARAAGEPASMIWRSTPLRLAAAAVPFALTIFLLVSNVDATLKLIVAAVLALSLASPPGGLLAVALLAPLGQLLAPLVAYPDFRIGEAIVVAFLGAWLVRGLPDRRGPRVPAAAAGALLGAA